MQVAVKLNLSLYASSLNLKVISKLKSLLLL